MEPNAITSREKTRGDSKGKNRSVNTGGPDYGGRRDCSGGRVEK